MLMAHVSIVNQFATWLSSGDRLSFDLCVFVTTWFFSFAIFFFFVEMVDVKGQSFCIKFCFKLTECGKAQKYFNKHLLPHWVRRQTTTGLTGLKMAGSQMKRTKVPDEFHSAQRRKVHEVTHGDRRRTIGDLYSIVGLSYGTCQRALLDELNMRRIAVKFVPSLLTDLQNKHWLEAAWNLRSTPELTHTSFLRS